MTLRRFRDLAVVCFVALPALTMSHHSVAEESAPSLVGTWSGLHTGGAYFGSPGHSPDRADPTFLKPSLRFTLKIEKQDGRGVIGTWSSSQRTERIVGVVRLDNETVLFTDEDTYFSAQLLGPDSMELCATETHETSVLAACLILNKE
jgi:hypothetical protein